MDVDHDQVSVEDVDGVLVLKLRGQFLGGDETEAVRNVLVDPKNEPHDAVLDMSGVTFANSSFLSSMLAMHSTFVRQDRTLSVSNLQRTLQNILSMTRLDTTLNMFGTTEEALHALNNASDND